jgi:predicted transcriptional regulator
MFKNSYHPKAFLIRIKNVKQGLVTRTKIASALEGDQLAAKTISERSNVRYSSVLYHLHLMEDEAIVEKEGKKPYMWKLTGAGQKRLTDQ